MADDLIAGGRLWHNLLGMLRLTVTSPDEANLATGISRALVMTGGAADFDDLKARVDDMAKRVRGHFASLIGELTAS